MYWFLRFRESSAAQWGLLILIIGILLLSAIPAFERIVQFADRVEFRYLANAFAGSVDNLQLRVTLKNDEKQGGIVTVDDVSYRLTKENKQETSYPFALANGARQLADLSAQDCGELLKQFTGQSYWLGREQEVEALSLPQPKIRAVVAFDHGLTPYCRFERPVRAGFWGDDSSMVARHVFAYYPASGRVEVLRETGEVK